MSTSADTICALATPPGVAGLAVIRLSGGRAFEICDHVFEGSQKVCAAHSHKILYGWFTCRGVRIDSVTVSVYRAPSSYTGEDVAEIGCHGGVFVTEQIIDALVEQGARYATPGEFTKRAFLNHKLDLTQVEAVADIIHAETRVGAQTAARQLSGGFTTKMSAVREQLLQIIGLLELELDFSEEDVEFVDRTGLRSLVQSLCDDVDRLAAHVKQDQVLRSGYHVAVVGFPNAGKSSLFNALLDRSRAIVSAVAGTTRDYLHETIIIDGYSIHLVDTAGLRDSNDLIELEGISLTASVMQESNLILVVNDASLGRDHSKSLFNQLLAVYPESKHIYVDNKIDLVHDVEPGDSLECSANTGAGIDDLKRALVDLVREHGVAPGDILLNARQAMLLQNIANSLRSCLAGMDSQLSSDLLAVDLRTCIRLLGEISGETWSPDVLETVFSRFCIGK